jgi:DNA polymerase I-like protein with 3'-5' exonuclease and polymerase domains
MKRIAIVDKIDRGVKYSNIFPDIEFDVYHLSTSNKKKLLKADMDIEINEEDYDFLILLGAEPTKFFSKGSVTSHSGYLLDDKYLPIIDPAMLIFKPSMKPAFDKAVSNILEYVSGSKVASRHRNVEGIEDEGIALELLTNLAALPSSYIAIDTETSSLYPRDGYLLGISLSVDSYEGFYISSDVIDEECTAMLQKIIDKHTCIFQNAKFDISWLQYHLGLKFKLNDVDDVSWYEDTLLMHYVLDETTGTHGLKDLCIKYTDLGDYDMELDIFKRQYCKLHKIKLKDFSYDLIPFDIMVPYACKDVMGTLELFLMFKKLIEGSKFEQAYILLKQGSNFLIHVENNGVPFNLDRLLQAQIILSNNIFALEKTIYAFKEIGRLEEALKVKFNPNSVVHLRYLFYTVLGLPKHGKKTATGVDSVDVEVLDYLAGLHPVVGSIAKLKKDKKIKSTYIDKILIGINRDNKLRTFFNLTTTTSGRLSSSGKLNMQQLPRDQKIVKACIAAPEGYTIVSQDLATAEMYVAAVLSKDKALMKVFIDCAEGRGADFHSTIAHMVFRLPCLVTEVKSLFPALRQAAKAISFGILYGSGPQKVADTVNEEGDGNFTLQDANAAIEDYFATFPVLKKWLTSQKKFIETNGFIYSIFGRKRRLGDVFSKDRKTKGHALRSGINFLVQSVASDINLLAGIKLQKDLNKSNLDAQIFALVHDSILAIVKDEDVPAYLALAAVAAQADYGVMIPNCPIGIDQEVGDDYSFIEHEYFQEAA